MGYRDLFPDELAARVEKAVQLLADCTVCARNCHVNRLQGEKGFCRGGRLAAVSSWGPHFGEEDVLVGRYGSGTIFFANCNLACRFCQNCDISQYGEGDEVTARELAGAMLELQEAGCHNINLVSPSHYVPQILEALYIAAGEGLKLPLVYNTGGYDALPTLKLLDGIVDIYMPDIKFGDDEIGERYTGAARYFTVARQAVKEMHRQVGDLEVDERGIAVRGLLVRHLVMPGDLSRTREVMKFLAEEISPYTFVNIMDQYYPAHEARRYPELSRRITREEFRRAVETARECGLRRIYA
ncbi:putative pyruvate formate lyase activating enzyme [Desulfofundulus australicus DSM 11792]|uniref:Putative pyruvate formate lyase activating enzyme n=1 Tax=Desulfofundulus australicus DSM 11792 TaxID=1121425 RepID=A0A1M5B934_9FIRM|nr:radical SAM protein [Desulfofundulus australicus]SHF38847.1 putative pyruvate formate lyase activating enzyme [Desulfofundulus australicus DSM 11792]